MKRLKLTLKRSTIKPLTPEQHTGVAGGIGDTFAKNCSGSCTNPDATICERTFQCVTWGC